MEKNYPDNVSRGDLCHIGEKTPRFGVDYAELYCKICHEPIYHDCETHGRFENVHKECADEKKDELFDNYMTSNG